jgi:hypothetical protein
MPNLYVNFCPSEAVKQQITNAIKSAQVVLHFYRFSIGELYFILPPSQIILKESKHLKFDQIYIIK